MELHYFSCFYTDQVGSGNPAVVVTNFTGGDSEKQALATKLNLPVTVFIDDDAIRFFYPNTEMSMCVHGSLAAGYHLLNQKSAAQIEVYNREGRALSITREADTCRVKLGEAKVLAQKIPNTLVCQMLNVVEKDIDPQLPCCIASVGSPKLLVPITKLDTLFSIQPNLPFIKDWSWENSVNGMYVYCPQTISSDANFHARAFNPKANAAEDAATGVAVGALLGAIGSSSLLVEQGYCIQKPSLVQAVNKNGDITVGGRVKPI